jgi:MFS family permease
MSRSFLPWIVISVPALSRRPVSPRLLAAVLVFLAVQSTAVASLGTPLLPTVQRVERVSLGASQWTLTITLLAGAVATPLMGRLGDGRLRRLTTVGAVAVMLTGRSAPPCSWRPHQPGAGFPRTPDTASPPESASPSWSPRWPPA